MVHWDTSCANMFNCLITLQFTSLFHFHPVGLSYTLATMQIIGHNLDKFVITECSFGGHWCLVLSNKKK